MSKELVIDFKSTGAVASLHMDAFDLGFLGDKKITRQTDIVFNEASQLWNLRYLDGKGGDFSCDILSGFQSYEVARDYEVLWLNQCRLVGISPTSADGMRLMQDIRTPITTQ